MVLNAVSAGYKTRVDIAKVVGFIPLVQCASHPGEGVVVQGPYYGSFAKITCSTVDACWIIRCMRSLDQGLQNGSDHLKRLIAYRAPAANDPLQSA